MKRLYTPYLATLLLLLSACTAFAPKTFNERLAAGYTTVTANRELNTSLVNARAISSSDGANVQMQNDNARAALDIASALGPDAGKDKLVAAVTILEGIKKYLLSKQVKP